MFALAFHLHADHFIIFIKPHANNTHGNTACNSYICFLKADAHAFLCHKEDILGIVCCLYFDQFIVIAQYNRLQSVLTHIFVFQHRSLLYHTLLCGHEQVFVFIQFTHWDNSGNLFSRLHLQQIYNGCSAGSTSCFRDLICLDPVYTACIGKEHHIVMIGRHKKVLNVILLNGLHSLNAFTSTVLTSEIVYVHTLDVT